MLFLLLLSLIQAPFCILHSNFLSNNVLKCLLVRNFTDRVCIPFINCHSFVQIVDHMKSEEEEHKNINRSLSECLDYHFNISSTDLSLPMVCLYHNFIFKYIFFNYRTIQIYFRNQDQVPTW